MGILSTGILPELTEQMTYNLRMVADIWLVEWSKRLAQELEKVKDVETHERLSEYKEDIRDIVLRIHELLSKISFDKTVDP